MEKYDMALKKTKHSKIKNTGLLFEFLVRQLTVDVLNDIKGNTALKIIKKRFNENTELGKELHLYTILLNEKFKSDKKGDYLISEALSTYNKINIQSLKREKYNLIKEIRGKYDLSKFLSSNVKNYKLYASIYKLFENNHNMRPDEKTEVYFTILEHITSDISINEDIQLSSIANYNDLFKKDQDVRILSYRYLLEKFNNKYHSLDSNQKRLLRAYINNITNTNSLTEYINQKIPNLVNELKSNINKVSDEVVKIKLKEAIHSINDFCKVSDKSKNVNDSVVVQMMRYYQLLKELKSEK
jgi:hypothetical protein